MKIVPGIVHFKMEVTLKKNFVCMQQLTNTYLKCSKYHWVKRLSVIVVRILWPGI